MKITFINGLRMKKERDQLEEVVTFLESELRRERGYV